MRLRFQIQVLHRGGLQRDGCGPRSRAVEAARRSGTVHDVPDSRPHVHRLPTNAFDFIYFFQSLHHIERLEHILGECARALRPNGLLMVNEFVGPSRFQWSDRQKAMADALISLLPINLRKDLVDGSVKTKALAPTVKDMILGILQRPFGRLKSNRR